MQATQGMDYKGQGNSVIGCCDPGKGDGKDGGKGWTGKIFRAQSVGSADGLDVGVKKEEGQDHPESFALASG